jgi:hypothetical protein
MKASDRALVLLGMRVIGDNDGLVLTALLAIRQQASANRHVRQGATAVTQMKRKTVWLPMFFNASWNFSVIKCPVVC